jgi:hypothetical protein
LTPERETPVPTANVVPQAPHVTTNDPLEVALFPVGAAMTVVANVPPELYAVGSMPTENMACVGASPCALAVVTVNAPETDVIDKTTIGAESVNCVAPMTDVTIRGP